MEQTKHTLFYRLQQQYRKYRSKRPAVQATIAGLALLLTVFTISLISFFTPRSVALSYEQETCVSQWLWLPQFHEAQGGEVELYVGQYASVFGYQVAARSLCIEPMVAPVPGDVMTGQVVFAALPLVSKNIQVEVPGYPEPFAASQPSILQVAPRDDIRVTFTQPDILFQYAIEGNSRSDICEKNSIVLSCSLRELELEQSAEYDVSITRLFHGQEVEEIERKRIKTIDPLEAQEASIEDGVVVYERPGDIRVRFNKQLQEENADVRLTNEDGQAIPFAVTFEDSVLVIRLAEDLPRSTEYQLLVQELYATDRAMLRAPFSLAFETSGGPAHTGSNIQQFGLGPSHEFRVSFDQPLKDVQSDIESAVVRIDGQAIESSFRVQENQLTVSPLKPLPLCRAVTFEIAGVVVSKYDVEADIDWSTQSRITCKRTSIIGYSAQGRPVYAYSFGDGPRKVLYVGGMHGNEYSSVVLMESWIDELDARPDKIPDSKTIIVVPKSSPDGVVARTRLTTSGVDLNRNFPTNDWQPEVYIPGPTYLEKGGGPESLSEPESKALATFVRQQKPELVLTYHAVASVVISNDAGNSKSVGAEYAKKAGYDFSTTSEIGDVFDYQATGAFEDWIRDELNSAALLIELATMNSDEINRNRDALWYSALLP